MRGRGDSESTLKFADFSASCEGLSFKELAFGENPSAVSFDICANCSQDSCPAMSTCSLSRRRLRVTDSSGRSQDPRLSAPFGRLLVMLPSQFSGGSLTLSHDGSSAIHHERDLVVL